MGAGRTMGVIAVAVACGVELKYTGSGGIERVGESARPAIDSGPASGQQSSSVRFGC